MYCCYCVVGALQVTKAHRIVSTFQAHLRQISWNHHRINNRTRETNTTKQRFSRCKLNTLFSVILRLTHTTYTRSKISVIRQSNACCMAFHAWTLKYNQKIWKKKNIGNQMAQTRFFLTEKKIIDFKWVAWIFKYHNEKSIFLVVEQLPHTHLLYLIDGVRCNAAPRCDNDHIFFFFFRSFSL